MKNICFIILFCFFCISANAKVRIGIPVYDPPYAIDDPKNGVSGFDIDFMKKICGRLNWECEFISMNYLELLNYLKENKVDFVIGAVVLNSDLLQNNFVSSIPYLTSDAGFLVNINAPIKKVNDLKGKIVGALKGRSYIVFLQEQFNGQVTIVPYEQFRSIALDLHNGKIDAIFMNYISALYIQHRFPEEVKVLNEHFRVGNGLGVVTLPANKDKIDQINKVILQLESDGTFTDLYNYNFQFFIKK